MKIKSVMAPRRLLVAAVLAVLAVLAVALPAGAAVHLTGNLCSSGVPCYVNYDTKRVPGTPGGYFRMGALIRMSSKGNSYCPASYRGWNNTTNKTETIDAVKIRWTDTKHVQHTTVTSKWGASWKPLQKTVKSLIAPWYHWTTTKCDLYIPKGQSTKYLKSGNGIWFYGHNSAKKWVIRIDLW